MVWLTKPPLGTQLDWTHPLNQGLAGFWLFNEGNGDKVYDLSGNGNDGTLYNMSFPSTTISGWNPGRLGPALICDGIDDYIYYGNNQSLNLTNEITVSVWMKSTLVGDWIRTVIAKLGISAAGASFWGITWTNANILGFVVRDAASNTDQPSGNAGEANDGNWHNLVGTANNTNVNFYMDGVLKRSVNRTAGDISNPNNVLMARHANTFVPITIDESRIWNRALTDTEIMTLYINPYIVFLDTCPNIIASLSVS